MNDDNIKKAALNCYLLRLEYQGEIKSKYGQVLSL
jgi:hypothetical protein